MQGELRMNNLFFDESLILRDVEAQTKEEIIRKMSDHLEKRGLVKPTYKQAVIDREKKFATGLPTTSCSVAIPHTDTKHVNEKSICVAVLKNPVDFGVMGDEVTTPVKLVFMLAMDEEHGQLSLLQKLMQIFQSAEMLDYLCNEIDKTRIKEKIESYLGFALKGGE